MAEEKKINFGCGLKKLEGFLNVDVNSEFKPDMIVDVEKPLPFKDKEFDYGLCSHVLEHLNNPTKALNEMIRVCKKLKVVVPHARGWWGYSDSSEEFYGMHRWFLTSTFFLSHKPRPARIHFNMGGLSKVVSPIANRSPLFYEIHLAHLFPALEIFAYFE